MRKDFLGGVVEGFYGQAWTTDQRMRLFDQIAPWGLNAYLYAPKDDLKHRAIWRESYSESELSSLAALVKACDDREIAFIYGLSPGLDIRFADPSELAAIKRRFAQMIESGVRHFALLFDDLPGALSAGDLEHFDSVAAAQSAIVISVFQWLREQYDDSRFLFCPTPYCDRMQSWELGGTDYLQTIGELLPPDVDVLWTGPEIVSKEISVESIKQLTLRIKRPPILWDNLHANDYDLRRLYCGPYSGRSAELLSNLRGILLNPNNEFPINFAPLFTLADFLRNPETYDPRNSFLAAIAQWHADFETVGDDLPLEELVMLAECYYLPYCEGPKAEKMKSVADHLIRQPVQQWGDAFPTWVEFQDSIERLFVALTRLKNRDLFHAWSRRVWELNEELQLIGEFLRRKKTSECQTEGMLCETHLPGTYRGGMVAELQQKLLMDDQGRFYTCPDSNRMTTPNVD